MQTHAGRGRFRQIGELRGVEPRAVAKEVAPFGITVNAICPGLINTDMVRSEITPERTQAYADSFPIPRLGAPQEVGQLALFLVTSADYITGASIDINGGDLMM